MDDNLYSEILQRLTRIEVKLDQMEDTKKEVNQLKLDVLKLQEKDTQQQKELDEIKDSNKWLKRAIIGACITAGVGIVFAFIKIGLGI